MEFLNKIADASPLPAGGAVATYMSGPAIGLINKIILLAIYRSVDNPEIEKNILTAKKELGRCGAVYQRRRWYIKRPCNRQINLHVFI